MHLGQPASWTLDLSESPRSPPRGGVLDLGLPSKSTPLQACQNINKYTCKSLEKRILCSLVALFEGQKSPWGGVLNLGLPDRSKEPSNGGVLGLGPLKKSKEPLKGGFLDLGLVKIAVPGTRGRVLQNDLSIQARWTRRVNVQPALTGAARL